MERLTSVTADSLSGEGALPRTYGFTTRAGNMGLLQITGFSDNPRGVKIRYKLVQYAAAQPAVAATAPSPAPAVDQAPANQTAAQVRLQHAEEAFTHSPESAGARGGKSVRGQEGQARRDLAAADLASNPLAAAIVTMQAAGEDLHDVESLQRSGAASTQEVEQARLKYELARTQFDTARRAATRRGAETASPATQPTTFPHLVHFEQGTTDFLDGDRITITEIRGTAATMEPGNTYKITGTYTLASHDRPCLPPIPPPQARTMAPAPSQPRRPS